jgi:VWFA-related protein
LVTDLSRASFVVFDDGKPQRITDFRREDTPASIGLVVDCSGSTTPFAEPIRRSARRLLEGSNPHSEFFLLPFNDRALLHLFDFTKDSGALAKILNAYPVKGMTSLRDACSVALSHMSIHAKCSKRVVIVLSDGNDNASRSDPSELIDRFRDSGTLAYILSWDPSSPGERRSGEFTSNRAWLADLATATGGLLYIPKNESDWQTGAERIALEIRSQYVLQYVPTHDAQDHRLHKVVVRVPSEPNVRVRTRRAYRRVVAPAPVTVGQERN